jgi:hypothetical protein
VTRKEIVFRVTRDDALFVCSYMAQATDIERPGSGGGGKLVRMSASEPWVGDLVIDG